MGIDEASKLEPPKADQAETFDKNAGQEMDPLHKESGDLLKATDPRDSLKSIDSGDFKAQPQSSDHSYPPKLEVVDKSVSSVDKNGERTEKNPDGSIVHKNDQGKVTEIDYPKPPGGHTNITYGADGEPSKIVRHNPDGSMLVLAKEGKGTPCTWAQTHVDKDGNVGETEAVKNVDVAVGDNGKVSITVVDLDQKLGKQTILDTNGHIRQKTVAV